MNVAVLVNPMSGRGRASASAGPALERFRARGVTVEMLDATSAAESRSLATEAVQSGVDALVVVGGDGLIFSVLPAVAGTDVPLGVIAGGTGNDIAREFGLPAKDPAASADVIADGTTRAIDLGKVGDKYFATVLASGFDAKVTQRANAMRWPKGPMRYNVAMLAELAQLAPIPYRIELDDDTIELDATLVAVGNTRSYGGGMRVCPDAVPDDGLLDITVVGATGRFRLVRMFPRVFKGTHIEVDGVDTYRSSRVRLTAPDAFADADGESIGPLPIDIEAAPGAVRLLVP